MSEFEENQLDSEICESDTGDHDSQQLVAYLDGELDEATSCLLYTSDAADE